MVQYNKYHLLAALTSFYTIMKILHTALVVIQVDALAPPQCLTTYSSCCAAIYSVLS